ncbi:MAG TPA: fibronectin type III domain-containing protein [Xanthomonadaceae bacterium]|nr:fibronectin type III domain-containing protein [Xanthomonadaceae bacterium]
MNALNQNVDVAAEATSHPAAATASSAPAGTASESSTPPVLPAATPIPGKVAIGFLSRAPDANLIAASGHILAALADNPHYVTPRPTLAELDAAQQAFVAAVQAIDRRPVTRVARDKARSVLVQSLRTLALYVQEVSKGDREILLGSGFPLQKGRQAIAKPATPRNLRLSQGNSGSLHARCIAVAQARSYQWRVATAQAPTAWSQAQPSTKANTVLDGLVPGTQYLVQVRAVGSKGTSDWSDSAVLFVN